MLLGVIFDLLFVVELPHLVLLSKHLGIQVCILKYDLTHDYLGHLLPGALLLSSGELGGLIAGHLSHYSGSRR